MLPLPVRRALHRSGPTVRETELFRAFDADALIGIEALVANPDLTINGITQSPAFMYRAPDATLSAWTAIHGDTLTKTGSGTPSLDQGCPTFGSGDTTVKGAAPGTDYSYVAPDASLFDVSTEDFLIEAVLSMPYLTGSSRIALAKYVSTGFWLYCSTAGALVFFLKQTSSRFISCGSSTNNFMHVLLVIDRDVAGVCYNNGTAGSAQTAITTETDISTAGKIAILGNQSGLQSSEVRLAYIAGWMRDSWLDTHLQATLAQQRLQLLTGVTPQKAKGTSLATYSRASKTFVSKIESSLCKLYPVADDWPVVDEHEIDIGVRGYRQKQAITNLVLQSDDHEHASWTKTRCSVPTADDTDGPDLEQTANTIDEDGTASNTHFVEAAANISLTSGVKYTAAFFAGPQNRDWVGFEIVNNGTTQQMFWDVSNGLVGTPSNLTEYGIIGPFAGDAPYLCWCSWTHAATEGRKPRIYICDADASMTFDGGSQESIRLSTIMVFAGSIGDWQRIITAASPVAVAADALRYVGDDGNIKEGKARIVMNITCHDHAASARSIIALSDGGSSADRMMIGVNASNGSTLLSRASGGDDGDIDGATDICDGAEHRIDARFVADALKQLVDGAQDGTPDTSADMPDDIDRIDLSNEAGLLQCGGRIRKLQIFDG